MEILHTDIRFWHNNHVRACTVFFLTPFMRPTYGQSLKFRWSALALAASITFVLLSNANQTPHHSLAAKSDDAGSRSSAPLTTETVNPRENEVKPLEDNASMLLATNQHAARSTVVLLSEDFPSEEPVYKKYEVKRGDTLSDILDIHSVHSSLPGLLALQEKTAPFPSLQPGELMELGIKEGKLVSLVHEIPGAERLKITLNGNRYDATKVIVETTKHEAHAFGFVTSSFYQAGTHAGLSDKIIIGMADILGWDIDFGLDVRKGDYFSVIYEEEYLNGEKLRDGTIQAVEFVNNGKTHRAMLYAEAEGSNRYFSPDGRSTRKPFLRNPIEYARISSHFSHGRLHPILKTVRPHRGIDYAAPHGTPLRATSDGRISFLGEKPGYGNVVIIDHGRSYSTLYAHLSRFASNASNGKQVVQGQVIGYVGATGYATGPHLHYEFRIGGVHKNPLTVELPDSTPLPEKEMAHFRQNTLVKLEQLDTLKSAYSSTNPSL